MPISFHVADVPFTLTQRKSAALFITQQVAASKYKLGHLSFVFCSDEYLLQLNRQFLQHDYYTDILTFPLSDQPGRLEGEVYISIDRVRENAEKYTPTHLTAHFHSTIPAFQRELLRVIFHGVLHLLGYTDKTKAQQTTMRKQEDQWLIQFAEFLQK